MFAVCIVAFGNNCFVLLSFKYIFAIAIVNTYTISFVNITIIIQKNTS